MAGERKGRGGWSTLLLDFQGLGWGRRTACGTPTSWEPWLWGGEGAWAALSLRRGARSLGGGWPGSHAAAPITFSPDLISHQGSCNFFQFST